MRNHRVCHIDLFRSQRFGHFLQIKLSGDGRHCHGEVLHIAVHRDQQRFVDLVRVQPQLAHHFITKVGFVRIVIVGVDPERNFVFFE